MPTDEMIVTGGEALHDALKSYGIDIDFDVDLKGSEIQQNIALSVFNAMIDN